MRLRPRWRRFGRLSADLERVAMSRGFDTELVPLWVAQGIEASFKEWEAELGRF